MISFIHFNWSGPDFWYKTSRFSELFTHTFHLVKIVIKIFLTTFKENCNVILGFFTQTLKKPHFFMWCNICSFEGETRWTTRLPKYLFRFPTKIRPRSISKHHEKAEFMSHQQNWSPLVKVIGVWWFAILIPRTKYLFVVMATKITADSFQRVQVYKQILVFS